jgi:hypothetical protein
MNDGYLKKKRDLESKYDEQLVSNLRMINVLLSILLTFTQGYSTFKLVILKV